jgi:hypothetical protein
MNKFKVYQFLKVKLHNIPSGYIWVKKKPTQH